MRSWVKHNSHLVIAILAASILIGMAVLGVGCATAQKAVQQAEFTLANTTVGGYRALNAYDKLKVEEIGKQAQDDLEGAVVAKDTYIPKRSKALDALDAASLLLEATDKLVGAVIAGIAQPADLLAQLPKLAEAGAKVLEALSVLGVKL